MRQSHYDILLYQNLLPITLGMFRPVARWQPKPIHCLKKWSSAIGIGSSLFFPPHSLSALRQEIEKEVSTPTQHWDGWRKRRKNETQRKKWEVKPWAATFYRAWLMKKKMCKVSLQQVVFIRSSIIPDRKKGRESSGRAVFAQTGVQEFMSKTNNSPPGM